MKNKIFTLIIKTLESIAAWIRRAATVALQQLRETAAKVAGSFSYELNVNTGGNKKLKNCKMRRFLIWNVPSVVTCPYATEDCAVNCYARKAEIVYPGCLPSRERNLEASLEDDFTSRMIYTIRRIMQGKVWRECPEVVFRIHESGDFYSKEYAGKWLQIMRTLKNEYKNLVFVAYTKSLPFFEGERLPSNFVLRASVWDDTAPEQLETIRRKGYPIYTAAPAPVIDKVIKQTRAIKCECTDCGTCERSCFTRKNKRIIVAIH